MALGSYGPLALAVLWLAVAAVLARERTGEPGVVQLRGRHLWWEHRDYQRFAASAGGLVSEDSPVPPAGFTVGSRIAGYRLEEQIGQGGMAVVFRAHDERLDRQVALKILAPALAADVAFRQRFIKESRAAAAVDDPHIIPVFEAGEASGVLFIAMRLVRGEDLRSLMRRGGPLPPGRVAEIVSQVASALDAAHRHGLVHRDVKPGNMLLGVTESRGRPDHVYLSDFGLSKRSLEASGLTGTGHFIGTLDYISPEQIAGRPVDGRADQYALACTSFELLSGAPPFVRDEAMAVMYAQLSEPPPALTSRRPGLPATVDAVFARALAKSPPDRYANCREFADALREALGPRPYDSGTGALEPQDWPQTDVVRPSAGAGAPAGASWADLPGAGAGAWRGQGPGSDAGPPGQGGFAGAGARAGDAAGPGDAAGTGAAAQSRPRRKPTIPGLTDHSGGSPGWAGGPAVPDYSAARGSRMRWSAVIAVGLIVLVAATGGAAFLTLHHSPAHAQTHTHQTGRTTHSVRTASLPPPSCGTAIGSGRSFDVRPAWLLTVPLPPYGAIVTADLSYTFVALPTAIEVLRNRAGMPVNPPVRTIGIPDHPHAQAITFDGQYLVTATDHGATVIRISAAEHPGHGAVIAGRLLSGLGGNPGGDDLALSTDDHFIFIAMRYANKIAVFNLAKALHNGFAASDLVGYYPTGIKPHGMAVSADGRWLYVTSRFARPGSLDGKISVLSVRTAEVHPARSLVSSASAGCGAFRIVISPDGNVLWVIAQESNYLVGFSASKLRTDPAHALIAKVAIGATPLDEVLVNGGTRILVTDNAGSDLAVVDPAAALAGSKHALVGFVKTTALPRFFAFEPDGPVVLLVTGDRSEQVQAIKIGDLP